MTVRCVLPTMARVTNPRPASDVQPYDALLLVLVRRARGARRRRAVPRERHPRPRHPARAAGGGRASTTSCSAGSRRSTTRTGRFLAALAADLAGGRHRPAGLLGQPQLGAVPRRHGAADGRRRRRRRAACFVDQRLLVVLRLPAVPREPRRRASRRCRTRRASTGCGTTSTTRASWSRWSTRRSPRSPTCPTSVRRRRPAGLRHPLDPDVDERRAAARTAAPTSPSTSTSRRPSPSGSRRRPGSARGHELVFCSRSGPPHVPWLEPDVNDHLEELARRRRAGGRAGADRVRLRPHGGRLRPRHRGAGDRREARPRGPAGRDRRASTRGSWRWCATCCSSGPRPSAARSRRGRAGQLGPPWDLCPVGCCANPRGRRPALGGELT